jgi:hypothetical protein
MTQALKVTLVNYYLALWRTGCFLQARSVSRSARLRRYARFAILSVALIVLAEAFAGGCIGDYIDG